MYLNSFNCTIWFLNLRVWLLIYFADRTVGISMYSATKPRLLVYLGIELDNPPVLIKMGETKKREITRCKMLELCLYYGNKTRCYCVCVASKFLVFRF